MLNCPILHLTPNTAYILDHHHGTLAILIKIPSVLKYFSNDSSCGYLYKIVHAEHFSVFSVLKAATKSLSTYFQSND